MAVDCLVLMREVHLSGEQFGRGATEDKRVHSDGDLVSIGESISCVFG